MYFGDGNLPTNYNISVDDKTDIELGLKIPLPAGRGHHTGLGRR
jgi:hypothetical protein